MHPSRAATLLALLGAALLAAALALRGFSLFQEAADGAPPPALAPTSLAVVGDFTLIEDGAQIAFQQSRPGGPPLESAWYSMPVSGGNITPYTPQEPDFEPFLLRGGRAYVLVADGAGVVGGSPGGEMLISAVLAPDRGKLAFATRASSGRARLYVLYDSAQLDWLGEEENYIDLDWSPTGERLAFVSPREGVDQIFTVRLNGDEYRQLTFDPARKSSPRWSPDGRSIAYLAVSGRGRPSIGQAAPTSAPLVILPTPTPLLNRTALEPARTDIFLMAEDGSRQRALTDSPQQEYALAWLNRNTLGFAARLPDRAAAADYYAIGLGGAAEGVRRVYPPVLLEGLECPAHFPADRPSVARIALSNSGQVPLDLPLILRARGQPFSPQENTQREAPGAVRVETVTLLPGESRLLEWEVDPAPGRVTYLSVITNLEDPFPLYEQHCAAPNSYLGLPNLPYLALSIPLGVLGLALCLPLLFQRRSLLWWACWLVSGLALLVMALLEIRLA